VNEAVLDRPVSPADFKTRRPSTSDNRRGSSFYGYSLTIIAIGLGWLVRDRGIVNPEEGLGYWLGIIGGSMMLLLLLYPLRKRIRTNRFLGATKHWFRAHMLLGIVGPLLVLYHCNFQLGSFNSQVALFCMLLVAGSGIVGRHFYAHIHRGLYGQKTNLDELWRDLSESMDHSHDLATLMPDLMSRLVVLSKEVQGDHITRSLGMGASLVWTFRQYVIWFSLLRTARRELRVRAAMSPAVAADFWRLRRTSSAYIRDYVRLMGRVAQFTLYEKLFSLWHVLHLPLFFMMVLSALLHVLAVHMY
jgi:hypothetical protein